MSLRDGLTPEEEQRFDEWAKFQRETNIAGMADSAMVVSIYPGRESRDVDYMLQVGACVLLDKPMLVLAPPGGAAALPPKLAAIADEVIEIDADHVDVGSAELAKRIAAFAARFASDGR